MGEPSDESEQELWAALSARSRVGERLNRRLGERRWGTVGGERRIKLFERMGLANPWDPDAEKEPPVAMGSVALKLTDRRQPAPHAKPPSRTGSSSSTSKSMKPSDFKPKGIPQAKKSTPKPPAPKPPAPRAAPTPASEEVAVVDPASLPRPPLPKPPKKNKTGRVRMRRTVANAPVFKPAEPDPSAPPDPSESSATATSPPEPAPEPVRRTPPGGDMGLDDLFGFSQGASRVKMPKREKKTLTPPPPDSEES